MSESHSNWKAPLLEETRSVLAANNVGTSTVWEALEQLFEVRVLPSLWAVILMLPQEKLKSDDPQQVIVPCRLSFRFLDDVLITSSSSRVPDEPQLPLSHGDDQQSQMTEGKSVLLSTQSYSNELTRMAIMGLR